MKKTERIERVCAIVILAIIAAILLSICIRFVVKNVIYEGLGIYNDFVLFWCPDDGTVVEDPETVTAKIDWERVYPFEKKEDGNDKKKKDIFLKEFTNLVNRIEQKIDIYTNRLFIFQRRFVLAINKLEDIIGWDLGGVLYMKNGFLTDSCKRLDDAQIEELANSVIDFDHFLKEEGIPLIFFNPGSNVCPYNNQVILPSLENTNENEDALLERLREGNIDVIDFRDEIRKNNKNWDEYYYHTDHHWTTGASLWAAGIIAKKLNTDYDFSFDDKYFLPESFNITHYKEFWLGSRGRGVTLERTTLDDYDLIIPKFYTNLKLEAPATGISLSGKYEDVILKMDTWSNPMHMDV